MLHVLNKVKLLNLVSIVIGSRHRRQSPKFFKNLDTGSQFKPVPVQQIYILQFSGTWGLLACISRIYLPQP
jgi:hypothetical protein